MGIRWESEGESRPAPAMSATPSKHPPEPVSLVGLSLNSWLASILPEIATVKREARHRGIRNLDMKKQQAIAILQQHEAEIRNIGATALYLFDSTSRDEARPDSDIDLFFDYAPDRPFSLYNLVDIKEFVSSLFGTPVDIMPRDSIHPLVRDRATSSAERIF